MSKSSRQIAQAKETPNAINSAASIPTHTRNKSIENRNFNAIMDRCRQLYMKNQMTNAIECIQRALYYDSDHLELNFMLGIAHLTLNAFSEAIQSLEKVALINNRFKNNIYLLIGIAHKKKGDIDFALTAVSRQISLNEDEEALFYRARIYL